MQSLRAIEPRRGFTLVELLVAMAVLAMMVLMLTSVFGHVSDAWRRGVGDIDRQRGERTVGDFIASELAGAQLPVETTTAAGKGNLQFLINPPVAQVPDAYRNADAIFWQAPLATETSLGDLAEVGYFVKWDAAAKRPALCRFFVPPSKQDAAAWVANPEFLIYDQTDPNKWLSETILNSVAPATKAAGYAGLLAENVLGIWVRSYGLDGVELPRTFDSRVGYAYKYDYTYKDSLGNSVTTNRTEQRYLPSRVDISIAQIESRDAARLDPVWEKVRDLTKDAAVRDAMQFFKKLQQEASTTAGLRPLIPTVRIYSTEVQLQNSR